MLRRLIAKVVASTLKKDLQQLVSPLQAVLVLKLSVKLQFMRCEKVSTRKSVEAFYSDEENAFNSLNRKAALHNIQISCHEILVFILNFCLKASCLFYDEGGTSSDDGTTQGDAVAMVMYALELRNLLQLELGTRTVFFADDGVLGGMLNEIKHCWESLELS